MAPRKVGFLHPGKKHSFKKAFSAFVERLTDIVEEDDVRIIDRWVASDEPAKTLDQHAQDLVSQRCKVIVAAGGPPSALALKPLVDAASPPIPVVFTSVTNPGPGADGLGLVDDLDA